MLFISAIGVTSQFQIAWSMIPDCVELDELKTGHRREGLFYASTTMIQKIMTAISTALGGIALSMIGYADGGSVTPDIVIGIRNVFAFGAAIPLGFSALIVLASPMTRSRHAALNQAIKLKD
jgi:GPH family glycoside/pentoside/hexuronide:cation symporter